MKSITRALTKGFLERNLFYESVEFAFNEKATSFKEYLRRAVGYAEEYSLDAIPIGLRLGKKFIKSEEAISELSEINLPIGIGLTYSAPFTRTARELSPTIFLSEIKDNKSAQSILSENTSRACEFVRKFESCVDFIILIDPMACNDLISPEYFKDYVCPSYTTLSGSTALPIILHMPGKILGNLPFLLNSGVGGLQPIDKDNLEEVIETSKGKLQIIGNISNRVLAEGSDEEVYKEFKRCSMAHKNKPWIVHTDFWIPKNASSGRVKYLCKLLSLTDFSSKKK